MKIVYIGAVQFAVGIGGATAGRAADLRAYGEAALRSRFVDDDLFVYSRGAVIQPNLGVSDESSGCFADLWANIGISDSVGDEVDYSVGCERRIGSSARVSAYASYYDFVGIDDHMFALGAEASIGRLAIQAYYYRPAQDEEADGFRLVSSYTIALSPHLALEARTAYDSGPYDGISPIWTGGGTVRYIATDHLTFSVTGLVPLAHGFQDKRAPQIVGSVAFQF